MPAHVTHTRERALEFPNRQIIVLEKNVGRGVAVEIVHGGYVPTRAWVRQISWIKSAGHERIAVTAVALPQRQSAVVVLP
jgi:hypothetical protein